MLNFSNTCRNMDTAYKRHSNQTQNIIIPNSRRFVQHNNDADAHPASHHMCNKTVKRANSTLYSHLNKLALTQRQSTIIYHVASATFRKDKSGGYNNAFAFELLYFRVPNHRTVCSLALRVCQEDNAIMACRRQFYASLWSNFRNRPVPNFGQAV